MKNKKILKLFVAICISVIATVQISLSVNSAEEILIFQNVEALATSEINIEEVQKYCTEALGICYFHNQTHHGIHMKMD